jgi:putative heme-binding domain-containing protein
MSRLVHTAIFVALSLVCSDGTSAEAGKVYSQKPETISTQSAGAATAGNADGMPFWIWGADQKKNYTIRKTFTGSGKSAKLLADCDNVMTLYVNGQKIAHHENWTETVDMDIQKYLKDGENVLLAEVENIDDAAGYVFHITITKADGQKQIVISDDKCEVSDPHGANWQPATVVAKYGSDPWGSVFDTKGLEADQRTFGVAPGFQLERLYSVPKDDLGSWVCITQDNKGRIIASDQGLERKNPGDADPYLNTHGLCRITPPPIGSSEPTKVEHLPVEMTSAQGLLWAFDSLYVCVNGKNSGLYRLRDTDGDDQFDEVKKLATFRGAGEHGPHALRLSPDGKSIYVLCGNHTKLPFDLDHKTEPQTMGGIREQQMRVALPENCASRLPPNWDEDQIVPRQWDANGHATGILAPGGWICKTDPDAKTWEVFTAGYRNPYDFAFDKDGEMFVYDADMEWDMGVPWYRPTRILHATSGSEFGWRSGTGKWPTHYPDSMPPILEIGPGSPVGVTFGYGTKFPAKFQNALFACDWTFATVYAVHLTPKGSSFSAVREEFLWGKPLPLTDMIVGNDGAMYFTVGGRNTQSELFRVTYVGKESTAPAPIVADAKSAAAVALRHELEKFHMADPKPSDAELAKLITSLGHEDRAVRYAARVALERVPLDRWQAAALKLTEPRGIITAAIGLARQGEPAIQPQLLEALGKLNYDSLSDEDRPGLLRAYQLVFIRLGIPADEVRTVLGKKFDALFPAKTDAENRELAGLMVALRSPEAAGKIVPLLVKPSIQNPPDWGVAFARNERYGQAILKMIANFPDLQQIHYAYVLRNLKEGWTFEERKQYFEWFNRGRDWNGGASFRKFLVNIESDQYKLLPEKDRLLLDAAGVRKAYVAKALPKPKGPGKDYTVDELVQMWQGSAGKVRDFANGKKMFSAARCVVCHRFAGEGGATGPDLSLVSGRFSPRDLGESIVLPSKVISDQYKTMIFALTNGDTKSGRVIAEFNGLITVLTDPEDATKTVEFKRSDVEDSKTSPTSVMPEGLLKTLSEEEVLDLYAYLLSGANERDLMFRRPRAADPEVKPSK